MPLYDYCCDSHGVFEEFNTLELSREPCACPSCGQASARVITVPNIRRLAPKVRNAMERNEKSREAPHVCHGGCHHKHKKNDPQKKQQERPAPQVYQGSRPWVIEHA